MGARVPYSVLDVFFFLVRLFFLLYMRHDGGWWVYLLRCQNFLVALEYSDSKLSSTGDFSINHFFNTI